MMDKQPVTDCPRATPAVANTYTRALHRACLFAGGAASLAARLGVAEASLREWMQGEAQPPQSVFLAAVEILLRYTGPTWAGTH